MKRFLIILMTAVIVFTVPAQAVYASAGTENNNTDWVTQVQNGDAVIDFARAVIDCTADIGTITFNSIINKYSLSPVLAVYDSTVGAVGAGMRYFLEQVQSGKSPQEAKTYMQGFINVSDGSSALTGDGLVFAQNYYADNNLSDLDYVSVYYPSAEFLNPSLFRYGDELNFVRNLIRLNPDCYFEIAYYSNRYEVIVSKVVPYACVLASDYWGNDKYVCDMFTENWDNNFSYIDDDKACISFYYSSNNSELTVQYVDSNNNFIDVDTDVGAFVIDDSMYSDANASAGNYHVAVLYFDRSFILDDYANDIGPAIPNSFSRPCIWHGEKGINTMYCFNTLADLKKGTVGSLSANILPSYNNNGINNNGVTADTLQQAETIINNFYDGLANPPGGDGGNGDDDNNNDNGDSDNGIWDTISSALRGVLQVLGELIAGLLDGIAEIIPTIANLFTGLKDLANTGFVEMLSAFFPFLPTEWFSVIGLGIGLVLLIFIVRVFKG